MGLFGADSEAYRFAMFGLSHMVVLAVLVGVVAGLYLARGKFTVKRQRQAEVAAYVILGGFETLYHVWMYVNGIWRPLDSLPLELCSISLILAVLLLATGSRAVYDVLLFTALLGATQALVTPFLFYDFPHFRFFHFFLTHILIVTVPLYFTWVKGYRPTIWSVIRMIVFLNLLLPVVLMVNKLVGGNYMYLSRKPSTASLLDVLGPYPWYILSLEGLLVGLSLLVWLLFRERGEGKGRSPLLGQQEDQ